MLFHHMIVSKDNAFSFILKTIGMRQFMRQVADTTDYTVKNGLRGNGSVGERCKSGMSWMIGVYIFFVLII